MDFDSDIEKDNAEKYLVEDVGSNKKLEPWVDWVRRTTHEVEERCNKLNLESWVEQVRGMKWALAKRICYQDSDRWSWQVFHWDPELHFPGLRRSARRKQARPKLRWSDEIAKFLSMNEKPALQRVEGDASLWTDLREEFIRGCWR